MSLGKRLRWAREKKNFMQVGVSKKTGIHNKTLSGYENDVSKPDFESLIKLADLYDVSLDFLITGREHSIAVTKTTELKELLDSNDVHIKGLFLQPEDKQRIYDLIVGFLWERIQQSIDNGPTS